LACDGVALCSKRKPGALAILGGPVHTRAFVRSELAWPSAVGHKARTRNRLVAGHHAQQIIDL